MALELDVGDGTISAVVTTAGGVGLPDVGGGNGGSIVTPVSDLMSDLSITFKRVRLNRYVSLPNK